ncbi:ABC transporter permease [Blautia sp. HCP3S3_G3]|uniref:ABC transporter permease n=1 Tax=Blautia sp. HCP3S3_G3 TaxID=3438913 RepID=UPI003F8CC285
MKEKRKKRQWFCKKDIPLYLMALPTVIWLIMFCYLPMGGLILSFKKYNVQKGIWGSEFVGLKNFEYLFTTSDAWRITRNTILYNVVFIALNLVLSVALALLLNELRVKFMAKTLQTVFIMPYFLSWAVVAILVMAFLDRDNGFVNQILQMIGNKGLIDWYKRTEIWPPLLIFINAWKSVGYQTVLFLATISGISNDYYEAAVLDGASRLQQARYITIPHLRFVAAITLIMSIGNIFRGDFGLFYTVTKNSGALYPVTDVIDTYIYRGLMDVGNVGMSAAAGFYQSVVGFAAVIAANKIVSKIDPDSAMF